LHILLSQGIPYVRLSCISFEVSFYNRKKILNRLNMVVVGLRCLCPKSYFCVISCLEVMSYFPREKSYRFKKIETNFKKWQFLMERIQSYIFIYISVSYIINFFMARHCLS
jgi:hypothetical protein